ncbi:MAG: AAA family ATPase [Bacteroidota bacterium]
MKLSGFRVQHFRSIINSGWNMVSEDNVTALIGQNESGKTSVLEALFSFYTGKITDDILRSDLSWPIVECSFINDLNLINKLAEEKNIPGSLLEILKKSREVTLSRKWVRLDISQLELGGKNISSFYDAYYSSRREKEENLQELLSRIINQHQKLSKEQEKYKTELNDLQVKLPGIKKQVQSIEKSLSKTKKEADRDLLDQELVNLKLAEEQGEISLARLKNRCQELETALQDIYEKYKYSKRAQEAGERLSEASSAIEKSYDELKKIENFLFISKNEKERRAAELKLDESKQRHIQALQNYEKTQEVVAYHKEIAWEFLNGKSSSEAEAAAIKTIESEKDMPSQAELGEWFFQHVPEFVLFEDFSSLLPNRIDLDELMEENENAEGIKAARNFLTIAGINKAFFQETNNRILKQKIEKLNNEITVNFQDYWRQNIGWKNKIKLNFELAHYDISHPEKMGKPYIEFWIKDEKERLYPKQRSRGVRWFLSFYLELKATAVTNNREKVLLIDEPGVSLHARAQEDVLKVFEDIRDRLMMIYSTHSPHLIDINKLYRILAVQRSNENDETSETLVLSPHALNQASSDTLSPIYTLMGTRVTDNQIIQNKYNVLLEDISCYHLLNAFWYLTGMNNEVNFIPAAGPRNIQNMANLLLGWKIGFITLLNDNELSKEVRSNLEKTIFAGRPDDAAHKILMAGENKSVIDLFSTLDFKNHIIHKRVGITETNSEYIAENEISLPVLAMEFFNRVKEGKIKFSDFDKETRENISKLVKNIAAVLT